MAKGKKIKLQKRSTPLTRTREGLSLPEGAGNSGYIGFKRTGLERKIFCAYRTFGQNALALRMFVLFVAQFMFTFILYNRIVEGIILGQLWICALFRYFIDPFYCAYSHVANIARYQTVS